MPLFRRAPAPDFRLDEILATVRTFDQRLSHVETQLKSYSAPQASSSSMEAVAGALGTSLAAMVSVVPELMKGQLELAGRMSDRVVKNSLSQTASDMGRRSGEKRRERAQTAKAEEISEELKQRQEQLQACARSCEDCAAAIENRMPAHTNDMLRHAREQHPSQLLIPLGVQLAS